MRQTAWTLLGMHRPAKVSKYDQDNLMQDPELSPREHEADDVNETVQEPRVLESEADVLESFLALTFP